jgi:hypothetical protein
MGWSKQQADAHEARFAPKVKAPEDAFEGPEEDLCQLIISELKKRRWYFTRNIPGRRSTATAGTTDFIVGAPNGVTYWVEVKKRNGKLSEAQNITRHVLLGLSHKWGCCYSLTDFIEFIDQK